jgi:ATP-dependent helicase YprA (DUF1998 family)
MKVGATPKEKRVSIFSKGYPNILITNPDLLHHLLGKLEHHDFLNWSKFLEKLRLVKGSEDNNFRGGIEGYELN